MKRGRLSLIRTFMTFVLFLAAGGCGDGTYRTFDDFLSRRETVPANPVFQKQYTTPSLSRSRLETLIGMSLYHGPPEQYGDLVYHDRSVSHGMDPVVFSHRTHRLRYTCRVCHLELEFSMKKGESGITREQYLAGRFCGACHNGKIAFPVKFACNLCHVQVDRQGNYSLRGQSGLFANLPEQDYGDGVDWAAALETGAVSPRTTLHDKGTPAVMPLPTHLRLPMRWTTREPRTLVVFPHATHIQWLDCANCHPDIFTLEQMGTVSFDKEKNLYGMYCGTCHLTVAFPMNGCSRCHPSQHDRP